MKVIKEKNYITIFLQLILGTILIFNNNHFITTLFIILGLLLIFLGIMKLLNYFSTKKKIKLDNFESLYGSITLLTLGLLITFLATFLQNAIRIITGICLIFIGINKLNKALIWREKNKTLFISNLFSAVLFVILGIYSIIAQNALLTILGIILIIYGILELFR